MKIILAIIFSFSAFFSFHQKPRVGIIGIRYQANDTVTRLIKERIWKVYHEKSTFIGYETYPIYNLKDAYVQKLFKYRTRKYSKIVGVTDRVIFSDSWYETYPVYGYSLEDSMVSIVSSYDLQEETQNDTTTANVVIHELGHLFGLNHCDDTLCVMTGYGRLGNSELCFKCRKLLRKLLKP